MITQAQSLFLNTNVTFSSPCRMEHNALSAVQAVLVYHATVPSTIQSTIFTTLATNLQQFIFFGW